MPHTRRFCTVLAAALGAAVLPSRPATADSSLQAVINLSTGYTDNVDLVPENPANARATAEVSSDTFASIAPGLIFSHLSPRITQVLLYSASFRLYAGSGGGNSFSNTVGYGVRFALSPRSSAGLDVNGSSGRLAALPVAPQDTLVGTRAAGDQSFAQATAVESYTYAVGRSWRFEQSLTASLVEPNDDAVQIGLRDSFGGSLGLSKVFNSHAFTASAHATESSFDQGEDEAGNDLGDLRTITLGPELRWVHDLSEDLSTDAMIGGVAIMPAYEWDKRDQFPIGSATLRYQNELFGASAGYQRIVSPNLALAQTEVTHRVEARGVLPVPIQHPRFRNKLLLSGAAGYSSGEFVRAAADATQETVGGTKLWLADLSLSWDASAEISAGLRYQRVWQEVEDPDLMLDEPQRTRGQTILLVLQGRYPARQAAVLPRDPSTRVDGGLLQEDVARDEMRRQQSTGDDHKEAGGEGQESEGSPRH